MSKLLEKAEAAYKKKNFDYAIELWLQHLKLKPDDLDCRKLLRKCSRERTALNSGGGFKKLFGKLKSTVQATIPVNAKDPEATMAKCEELVKDDPSNNDLLFRLGQAAALANHHESAIWVFCDIMTRDKKHKEATRYAARSCRSFGQYDEAIRFYEKLRKLDPADAEATDKIRDIAANQHQKKMSARQQGGGYRDLIDEDRASKMERLGRRVRTPEEARERIIDLKEELENEPDSIKIHLLIADMYTQCKDGAQSKEWLEKALVIDPEDFQALERIGDLKLKKYDVQLAKLRKDPSSKAKLEEVTKQRVEFQIAEYTKRFEAHPTELKYAFMLGKAYHEAGQHEAAINELQKAKTDSSYRVEAGYYLGLALFQKKNLRLSVKELQAARASLFDMDDDNNKRITYLLGRIYEAAKKSEKALEEYEKIAEVDYGYKDIEKRMEKLGQL
jgi:tetratricopeptide (TPR) repeat protein